MNKLQAINEIKAPEEWKTSAKGLWNDKKSEHKSSLRVLRPLPIAAALACLLIGTAAAVYAISEFNNPIVINNEAERIAAIAALDEGYDDDREHPLYSEGFPLPEQDPLSSLLESATYTADHWEDEIYVDYQLLGADEKQDWTFEGFDSSEGPLWKRHASTSKGWTKEQYVAETLDALNEADPESVVFSASLDETGLSMIPFGNRLEIAKDEKGSLLGVIARLCWLSEDERYFQLEYDYEAFPIDWGTTLVSRESFDDIEEFTADDGREFVITTYQDRLWAESITPNVSYHFYAIGIGIEEAETILNSIRVTVGG